MAGWLPDPPVSADTKHEEGRGSAPKGNVPEIPGPLGCYRWGDSSPKNPPRSEGFVLQVAVDGFCASFFVVWLYGRLRELRATAKSRETGFFPFLLFLGWAAATGWGEPLFRLGLLPALGVLAAVGFGMRLSGKDSSARMILADALAALVLVILGLQVPYLTSPSGGYLYLDRLAAPLTWLWLLAFLVILKVANRLPGLFQGVMALLSYLLLGSLLYQSQHTAREFHLVVLLSGVATAMWWNAFGAVPERLGRISCSLWALTLGALTILTTSKKVATVAILTPVGLGLAPLFFFPFVIFQSYFLPRLRKHREDRHVYRLSLSRERLVAVILLFCLLVDLLLLLWLFVPSQGWVAGFGLVMSLVFYRIGQLVLSSPNRTPTTPPQWVEVFGVRFWARSAAEHREVVRSWLGSGVSRQIVTPDSLALLKTFEDPEYRQILTQADLVLPDGAGVIWASDFLAETKILERCPGCEFMLSLLALAEEEGVGVYFLGAKPEVLEAAVAEAKQRFPKLIVSGARDGYFEDKDSGEIADEIRRSGAKICFLALGVPKQEFWIRDYRDRTGAEVLIGVGGSLDVLSGTLPRASSAFQSLGLEWLHRVLLEPWRLGRVIHLPRFVLQVLEEKLASESDPVRDPAASS